MACCEATPVVISCTRPPPPSQCIKVNVPPQCVTCVVPPPPRCCPPPKMVNIPVVICEKEEPSCGGQRSGRKGKGGGGCGPPSCCPPSCCKPSCVPSCGQSSGCPPPCAPSCCKPSCCAPCGGQSPTVNFCSMNMQKPKDECCKKPRREKRWPMCNFMKPCIDTRIYRDGEALCISYAGHIPGEQFIHGRNLPTTTTFAKRRLCQYTPYEFIDPDGCCTFP